jgi:hypothetical protein
MNLTKSSSKIPINTADLARTAQSDGYVMRPIAAITRA